MRWWREAVLARWQKVASLDKALQLLEKGLDAIIDAAGAVVQGVIKAAGDDPRNELQWASGCDPATRRSVPRGSKR